MLQHVFKHLSQFSVTVNVCHSGSSVQISSIFNFHQAESLQFNARTHSHADKLTHRKQHGDVCKHPAHSSAAQGAANVCTVTNMLFLVIPLSLQWLVYPHKYFCIIKTALFWTNVCLFERKKSSSLLLSVDCQWCLFVWIFVKSPPVVPLRKI